MSEAINHRGPDAGGDFVDKSLPVFLGHKRLSILDISGGNQPMTSSCGNYVIVFNGEIYNNAEIRNELKLQGHRFNTNHSDTEVILESYKKWGYDCVKKFNGMWAFCIYDISKKQLFCSRDRFGKKPFFYTFQSETFIFASELSSLCLHPVVKKNISNKSIQKFFAYNFIPAPMTIYEYIYKLEAGYNLIFDIDTKKITKSNYWRFQIEQDESVSRLSHGEIQENLIYLLGSAVKRRLQADVEVGVFLSGGIDSSAIAYFAKKYNSSVKTFSIGFEDKSFDESAYSDFVSNLLHTEHYSKVFTVHDLYSIIDKVLGCIDEPIGDASLIPTFMVSNIASQKVKVILGGDGGDELFCGYDPFRAIAFSKVFGILPECIRQKAHYFSSSLLKPRHNNMSLDYKITRFTRGLQYDQIFWLPSWMSSLGLDEVQSLFECKINMEELYSESIDSWNRCSSLDLRDKFSQYFIELYLQNGILTKIDRASMLNSVEVRSPFLDIGLVDFVRKLPADLKYKNGTTKYILKKAVESFLPKEIIYRKKKGFGMPTGKWFAQGEIGLDVRLQKFGINEHYASQLQNLHIKSEKNYKDALWNILALNQFKGGI
jgi:asparagine synthase (glutamine-hydrolysing)